MNAVKVNIFQDVNYYLIRLPIKKDDVTYLFKRAIDTLAQTTFKNVTSFFYLKSCVPTKQIFQTVYSKCSKFRT